MQAPTALDPEIRRQLRSGHVDRAIAVLADRQHRVVARWQLIEIGLGAGAISHRLQCGRLHLVHRGVYAVGHTQLPRKGRWMAAVLAVGTGAALSHRPATVLWGLLNADGGWLEVTRANSSHPRRGIRVYCGKLPPDEITAVDGIPVTTVPRTLLDLAAVVPARQVERALAEAEVARLFDALSLRDMVARYPTRPGIGTIKALLGRQPAGITRSDLEELFIGFLDRVGLLRPETNQPIALPGRWIEADCVWRGQRLIVELDSRGVHDTATAFESDRARDRAAHVAGWQVVRVTWRQLRDTPGELERDLRILLCA